MATIINARDKLLQSAPTRISNPANAAVLLAASTPAFHVDRNGINDPATITFRASMIGLDGQATFSAVGATLSVTGNVATLTYANMPGANAAVTASVTENGQTYSATCAVSKVLDGANGANGSAGANNAIVYAYQRAASAPAGGPGAVSYDFASGTITTPSLANGWLKTIPTANGNPLYVTVASASSTSTTAAIAGGAWAAGVIQAQNGSNGSNGAAGLNVATVTLYQRALTATAPAVPSGTVSYTFATGAVSGSGSWSAAYPAATGGPFLFATLATASNTTATDTIAAGEWSTPRLVAQDGTSGHIISDDPLILNPDAWSIPSPIVVLTGTTAVGSVTSNHFDAPSFASVDRVVLSARAFPIDPSRTYDLTANLYAGAGNDRNMYVLIQFYDAAGAAIPQNGWGGSYSGYTFGAVPTPAGQFSRCGGRFGASTARPTPGNARTGRIGVWFQYSGGGSSSVEQAAQDLRLIDVTDAAIAASAAATAQADATNALNALTAIASDNVLSKGEKPAVILDWQAIQSEATPIYTQGTNLGVIAERDAFNTKYTNLLNYMNTLDWSALTTDTAINGPTFRTKFSEYYAAKVVLLNAIAAKAATTANWATVANRPSDSAIYNNLIDLGWWARDAAIPWGLNGSTEFNRIIMTTTDGPATLGPKGYNDLVWYAEETQSNSGQGGGWESTAVTLDPAKTYRFVVPIKRLSGSGTAYWGTENVCTLNTATAVGNPYFAVSGAVTLGKWYLFVGYVYPAGSTGNTHDGAGIYDCETGAYVSGGTNYNLKAGNTTFYHRAYQYYASQNAKQIFGRPMVNIVDGTEPSLREYFSATAVLNQNQQWSDVSGTGRPADYATVGAQSGINLRDSGGNVMSDALVRNGYTENGIGHVMRPQGGSCAYGSGKVGALEIALPVAMNNSGTMIRFRVEIYEYTTGRSCTYIVSGYNYMTPVQWYNVTAEYSGPPVGRKRVRFGNASGRNTIYIGETNSVWEYPQVRVTEVTTGYSNYDWSQWANGWACGIYAGVGTINAEVAEPGVGGAMSRIDYISTANAPNYIQADAITDSLIGGNLKSTNWNGHTGLAGAGWLLERSTGNFYGNSARLRGAIFGGSYEAYAWPANPAHVGYYLGSEGLLLGNYNGGRYIQISAAGNFYSSHFNIIDGVGTLGALSISNGGHIRSGQVDFNNGIGFFLGTSGGVPKFSVGNSAGGRMTYDGVNFTITNATITAPTMESFTLAAMTDIYGSTSNGSRSYGQRTATPQGGVAPYSYIWTKEVASGSLSLGASTTATVSVSGSAYEDFVSAVVTCTCTDANGRSTRGSFYVEKEHTSGGIIK